MEGLQQQTDQAANLGEQHQNIQQDQQQQQQQEEKLLPQSDVNNLVAKEAKKAQEKLLKQLGIEDFNSAKEGLAKFKEWQESQKTEQEKLSEKLTTFESQLGEKESLISKLQAENAAIKAGITDEKNLKAVITLAKTLVNEETDINAAINQVIEDYPHFKSESQQEQTNVKFTTGTHTKQQVKNDAFVASLFKK